MTFKKPISRIINALNSSSTHIPIPPEYASLELSPCPPTKLEEAFSQQFSGRIQTYSHQQGLLILRQVRGAKRKLLNTDTCLRVSGFNLSQPNLSKGLDNRLWLRYLAWNKKNHLTVQSIITSTEGKSWPTVKDWFWDAFFAPPTRTYLLISDLREITHY